MTKISNTQIKVGSRILSVELIEYQKSIYSAVVYDPADISQFYITRTYTLYEEVISEIREHFKDSNEICRYKKERKSKS